MLSKMYYKRMFNFRRNYFRRNILRKYSEINEKNTFDMQSIVDNPTIARDADAYTQHMTER